MYSNIFLDIEIDGRRMKKLILNSITPEEMPIIEEVRLPQPVERPEQERDRPLPSRYDDDRRDRYDDRRFEQMQYADLYRFGY